MLIRAISIGAEREAMNRKIAIPCIGEMINEHFGRAQTFEVYEIADVELFSGGFISTKEFAHKHEGIALLLKDHGIDTVICAGIGAGAIVGLRNVGMEVLRGARGKVNDIAKAYVAGTFSGTNETCDHSRDRANYRTIECLCED